ncbi:MAG TPA: hypothetical protein VN026_13420 [Bacteroidia bacterium]|jgi:hypothetical protein|nr:hypothetical protein [Bacteroidia bacterium]
MKFKNRILSIAVICVFVSAVNICNAQSKKSLLIGKWNYVNQNANPLSIPNMEFKADSTAKLIQSKDHAGNYKYFLRNDTIYLKTIIGENKQLILSKLKKDSLQVKWTIFGTTLIDYYKSK